MFELVFEKIFLFVSFHKKLVVGFLCALIAFFIFSLTQIHFDNDVSTMLPLDSNLRRDFDLVRESVFAGKVVLSFELINQEKTIDDMVGYLDQVALKLPGALVTDVVKGATFSPSDLAQFINYSPRLVNERYLDNFVLRMDASNVETSLRQARTHLISFQGIFTKEMIRIDPLGIFTPELKQLEQLSRVFGKHVSFYNGHFATKDGKNLMLILKTPVAITDGTRSASLIAHIKDCIKDRPSFIQINIIAGHNHAIANETLIKGDIARTSTVASIVFLLVLVVFFKDLRAAVFFLIPACSILMAMVISGMVFGKVSAFVAALSSVIIGIADDYGIHVYTAIRTASRRDIVIAVARPIFLAAMFTSSIFFVFFFSTIPGYHQLALLTITSILLCTGFVLLIYPHFVTTKPFSESAPPEARLTPNQDRIRVFVWGLSLLILGFGATKMNFSSDITSLDGAGKEVLDAEEHFEQVWTGSRQQGIFVVEADTLENALEINERVYLDSSAFSSEIASIAPFFLPRKQEEENIKSWQKLWVSEKGRSLCQGLEQNASSLGFSKDAFQPFFKLTRQNTFPQREEIPFLKQLSEKFVIVTPFKTRVMTFFPDEPKLTRHFENMALNNPGSFVFSKENFSKRFSLSINQEALRLAGFAGVMLALVAILFLRRIKLVLICLSVTATCLLAVAAVFGFWGKPLTSPAVVALMIAVGLSIDYGVFTLFSMQHNINTGTSKAIGISALTTLIGALSLLTAKHPALFAIGVSLSSGLGAGWLCAQAVVPSMFRLFCQDSTKDKS